MLIVTWTMDEGHALARVLTPGFDSKTDWKPYTKNYKAIAAQMRATCPARQYGRLGTYWTTMIGKKRVTLFKSDSHMSQDGPKLPNKAVWEQIIADCKPELVITTGTGGGIGTVEQVGDVIVSSYVSFDCQRQFESFNGQTFKCDTSPSHKRFASAESLFSANAQFLPADNRRPPRIIVSGKPQTGIVTTDFFGFDNSSNTYGLQGKGDLSEMGDAVLGLACKELGAAAPTWVIVRNVSDPQIDSTGLTLKQQAALAADIYKGYGRWSSVGSSIVCWALTAALYARRSTGPGCHGDRNPQPAAADLAGPVPAAGGRADAGPALDPPPRVRDEHDGVGRHGVRVLGGHPRPAPSDQLRQRARHAVLPAMAPRLPVPVRAIAP